MEKEELLDKLEHEKNKLDLSKDEDLSIALMNLISLEEHLYFTSRKTGEEEPVELLKEIREIRTEAMKEIVTKGDGEEWCISKHLLASSMRMIETGNKMLGRDDEKAEEFFEYAFELYSLFWAVNLLDGEGDLNLERDVSDELSNVSPEKAPTSTTTLSEEKNSGDGSGLLSGAKDLVTKVIDCCIEK